jgi:hypothetical protein
MSFSKRKNLIILRAGDKSLHPVWYSGCDRSWDLALSYYGDLEDPFPGYRDFIHICKGSKWQGIADFCAKNADLLSRYERIWLPDDDLLIDCDSINEFFLISGELNFGLTQPSLTIFSYVSHPITIRHPGNVARETNFVEIMAPCFSAPAWAILRTSFSENPSGWGLEWFWVNQLHTHGIKVGIIDAVSMYHSRPVGSAGHGGSSSPRLDMKTLLTKHGLAPHHPATLEFIRSRAGSCVSMSTDDLASANQSIVNLVRMSEASF